MQKLPFALLSIGFIAFATSMVTWFVGPQQLSRSLKIIPDVGPERWNSSVRNTNNLFKVYLFNVTNPANVINGEKPNLMEIGPYVFQFSLEKSLDSPQPHDTILFKENEQYYFRADLSGGKESDVLTIINLPFVGLANEISKLSLFSRLMVLGVVSQFNEGLFLTKTAKQLLFGGYKHELLATLSRITGEQYMANNTFGLFYERNNSNVGEFTFSTGKHFRADLGKVLKWNGTSELKWWKDPHCRKIEGSFEGSQFPPGVFQEDKAFTIFDPAMCRTVEFGFEKDIVHDGVSGKRFRFLPLNFEDPRVRPENKCYCTHPGKDGEDCPKKGSYQINTCAKEASISISLPHFLHGSEDYVESANGYHPDEEKHGSYYDIDPVTGTLLRKVKRMQINLHIKPLQFFGDFRKIPNMLFPAVWVEEFRELTSGTINELTGSPTQILVILASVQAVLGLILIATSVVIFLLRLRKDETKYNT